MLLVEVEEYEEEDVSSFSLFCVVGSVCDDPFDPPLPSNSQMYHLARETVTVRGQSPLCMGFL